MKQDWSWKPQASDISVPIPRIVLVPKQKPEKKKQRREKYRKKYSGTRDKFYLSDAWLDLRYRVLKHYGGRCQCCGASAKDGIRLNVDHIKPRSKYPRLELQFSNLQVLCSRCNLGKGAHDETDWRDPDALTEEQRAHMASM